MTTPDLALDPPYAGRSPWSGLTSGRRSLFLLLAVLNALDLLTTELVLLNGGAERNPVMEPVVDVFWHGVLVKSLVLAIVAALAARCPTTSRRAEVALAVACAWYLFVVCWNVSVVLRLV